MQNTFFAFQFCSIILIRNSYCYVYLYLVVDTTDDACYLRLTLTAIGSQHSAYLVKQNVVA
jgi:hypothetical protein